MDESIFKAYDIRGIYPGELNENAAERIGSAFVKYTRAKKILVGEDARLSTPALRKKLFEGITGAGADIIFAGRLTTPMFYFAVAENAVDGGIMVTASHNPEKYNGFKLVRGDAMPIGQGSGMEQIKILAAKPQIYKAQKKGRLSKINIEKEYIEKILSLADTEHIRELKVAIDAGNGMAGAILPGLLKNLPGLSVEKIYFDVDMSFPNHEANPLKEETLDFLKKRVGESNAHIGIAYDGDGDRVGFIDEKGSFVRADYAFCAILPELLKEHPGSTVLYDLRCSKILPEEIARQGGKPQMTRVGHAFIKKQLQETKGAGAVELSSHFYFKNFYNVECSDLVMLYMLIELSRQNKPFSKIIEPYAKYSQSGEINFEVKDKSKKIEQLKNKYRKQASHFSDIDGIRLEFQENGAWWWFNARPSNTEPLLRLNMEANNKELLAEKLEEITKIIEK